MKPDKSLKDMAVGGRPAGEEEERREDYLDSDQSGIVVREPSGSRPKLAASLPWHHHVRPALTPTTGKSKPPLFAISIVLTSLQSVLSS
jgi:hypothetical protein